MKNLFPILFSAVVLVFAASCTQDKGVPTPPVTDTVDSTRLIDVRYSDDIQPLMVTYCYGKNGQSCHVSASNVGAIGDFTNYEGLKAKVDDNTIKNRIFDKQGAPMPPVYSNSPLQLTATDMAVFKKWVAEGAQNN